MLRADILENISDWQIHHFMWFTEVVRDFQST